MEVKDLMIENWVSYNGTNQQAKEIIGFDNQICPPEDEVIDLPKVLSIPLTKEILEKNGFVCLKDNKIWFSNVEKQLSGYGVEITITIYNSNRKVVSINTADGGLYKKIKTVHELQHCLDLFEINKKIIT